LYCMSCMCSQVDATATPSYLYSVSKILSGSGSSRLAWIRRGHKRMLYIFLRMVREWSKKPHPTITFWRSETIPRNHICMHYGPCSAAAKAITGNPKTVIHSTEAGRTAMHQLLHVNKPLIAFRLRRSNFSNGDVYQLYLMKCGN